MKITLFIFFFSLKLLSQNIKDSILSGDSLLNLNQAVPNAYYRFNIDDRRSTLIKFSKGEVIKCLFEKPVDDDLKIDTSYFEGGLTISLKNKSGISEFNTVKIYKKGDDLSLIIAARDPLNGNLGYGTSYYFYSNKQLSGVIKSINCLKYSIRYERNGNKASDEIRDSLNKLREIVMYTSKNTIDWKMRILNNVTIREQYDGKGNLIQIDSTNSEHKHIGTVVCYYPSKIIKRRTPYFDGKINGINYTYFPNGNINTMETYVNGQKSGKYIHYNQNGTIKKEGFISNKKS